MTRSNDAAAWARQRMIDYLHEGEAFPVSSATVEVDALIAAVRAEAVRTAAECGELLHGFGGAPLTCDRRAGHPPPHSMRQSGTGPVTWRPGDSVDVQDHVTGV